MSRPKKPLLLETIKCNEGTIENIDYHQQRFDTSRKSLYGKSEYTILQEILIPPKKGIYRCRILYAQTIQSIEYIPYHAKKIQNLQIVPSSLDYTYKYADRENINKLVHSYPLMDDVLIEKKGYITDTSIANIAFYDGETWVTPEDPLLKGTTRQRLLDKGFLKTKMIQTQDLAQYSQVALMNAMLGFTIVKNITIHDNTGRHYDY